MFLEPPPHAHNVFLNTLAEQGLIGLSAFLALLCALVWRTWRLMRDDDGPRRLAGMTVFAALVAFMLHNLVDVTLFQSETGLFFWVLVGIISGLSTRRDTGGRSDGDVAQMRLAGVTQASAADALARARCRPKRSAARM
jgi:O-antigen ligase